MQRITITAISAIISVVYIVARPIIDALLEHFTHKSKHNVQDTRTYRLRQGTWRRH